MVSKVLVGETIPLDGTVVEHSVSIDESMMTGEPYPVRKKVGSEVMAVTEGLWNHFLDDDQYRRDVAIISEDELGAVWQGLC